MIFKHADKEDFGTYSVSVTNTEGVSASYDISAEGSVASITIQVKLMSERKEKINDITSMHKEPSFVPDNISVIL